MATDYVDAGQAVANSIAQPHRRQRAAGDRRRHLRAHPQRPLGAAELAHLLRRLRRAALQPAGPDQQGERQAAHARVGLPVRLGGPALGQVDVLVRGLPARRRRHHVRLGLGRLGLGARRPDRQHPVAVQDRVGVRRVAVLRQREPGRRRRRGQGLRHHPGRARDRARRRDRQEGLGPDLRRRAGRRERHHGSADRQGHGHRRQLRR